MDFMFECFNNNKTKIYLNYSLGKIDYIYFCDEWFSIAFVVLFKTKNYSLLWVPIPFV